MRLLTSRRATAAGWAVRFGLVLSLIQAAGCGTAREERTADGRIVIQYWEKWIGFESEAMDAVVGDFNASQDRYFVRKLPVSQIAQKLMLATAGGNPPDLAGLWSHSVNDYAEKGALIPLDGLAEKAGITREDYIPVFWDLCEHRGFLWALPTTPATVALHWNKKKFRDAGLDPERPPRSLDELDALAERLTVVETQRGGRTVRVRFPELTDEEKKDGAFRLVEVGHLPQEPGWFMEMWGFWFGGRLWDGDRTLTADSPENLAAFHWLRGQSLKYGLDNLRMFGASFGNFSSPQNPFLSGQVAMVLQGVWMYNFIDKYAPGMEWGVAPFPASDPERFPGVSIAECDTLVIPKGSPHPEAAFEFMRYVNTQPAMEKLCRGQRKFSPLARMSPDFVRSHPTPYLQTFIDLAKSPNVRAVPRVTVWSEYKEELRVAADQVLGLLKTPEAALAAVQQRAQWKLDRVTRRWDLVKADRLQEWSAYDAR